MGTRPGLALVLVLVTIVRSAPAAAQAAPAPAFVLGGGAADTDCRIAYGDVNPTPGVPGNSQVVCRDGDPSCDTDGTANGVCRFTVTQCTDVPEPGCTPIVIDTITVAGLPLGLPPLPSDPESSSCGPPLAVAVPVGTAVGATSLAESGGLLRDVDYLNLCCRPPTDPLAAARCALAIDLKIAGCPKKVSLRSVRALYARAGKLVERAAGDPAQATALTARAVHLLRGVRTRARRLAKHQPCGDALALMASQALLTLGATP